MIKRIDYLPTDGNIVEDENVKDALNDITSKLNEVVDLVNEVFSHPFFASALPDFKE